MRAIQQAQRGDAPARAWLADRAFGRLPFSVESKPDVSAMLAGYTLGQLRAALESGGVPLPAIDVDATDSADTAGQSLLPATAAQDEQQPPMNEETP